MERRADGNIGVNGRVWKAVKGQPNRYQSCNFLLLEEKGTEEFSLWRLFRLGLAQCTAMGVSPEACIDYALEILSDLRPMFADRQAANRPKVWNKKPDGILCHCGETDASKFHKNKTSLSGLHTMCKACRKKERDTPQYKKAAAEGNARRAKNKKEREKRINGRKNLDS